MTSFGLAAVGPLPIWPALTGLIPAKRRQTRLKRLIAVSDWLVLRVFNVSAMYAKPKNYITARPPSSFLPESSPSLTLRQVKSVSRIPCDSGALLVLLLLLQHLVVFLMSF
jgi:hypothetical protein